MREIEAHGVTSHTIDRVRGNHPKLRFEFKGREFSYTFSASSSDWRAAENAVSDIRRILGVKRLITKSAAPKRLPVQKALLNKSDKLPTMLGTALPNEFEKLAALRARLTETAPNEPPGEDNPDEPYKGALFPLRTPWLGRRQRWQHSP